MSSSRILLVTITAFAIGVLVPATNAQMSDPTVTFSTFVGGAGNTEVAEAVAVDANGNIVVVGYIDDDTFPLLNAYDNSFGGPQEAFVFKISPAGQLVFSTYLGGSEVDKAFDVKVDADGYIYVYGETWSHDFPLVNPYDDTLENSAGDVFITKFTPDGSSIVYSTFLGGSYTESYFSGMALDAAGNIYVTGTTLSSDFPMVMPVYGTHSGYHEIFVAKLSADGSTLLFSTYLGGTSANGEFEHGFDIAVDSAGSIFVTGTTVDDDFPIVNAVDPLYGGGSDCFVTKFEKLPEQWIVGFSTYLGGLDDETWPSLDLDPAGNVYVCGQTQSSDFPVENAYNSSFPGNGSGFVTKLSSEGAIIYSTFIGGGGWDYFQGIAVDTGGRATVCGFGRSFDYPLVNPIDSVYDFSYDIIISTLAPDGQTLNFSSFLGGIDYDHGREMTMGLDGELVIVGVTDSPDFPIVRGFDSVMTNREMFVTVIADGCCNHDGIRGDMTSDGALNVSDLTYLVDFLFRGGPEPFCSEEGDVNGSSTINVSDLTYLVDYLFRGGSAPVACP